MNVTSSQTTLSERYLVFQKSNLLIYQSDLPDAETLLKLQIESKERIFLMQDKTYSYWILSLSESSVSLKDNFKPLRSLFGVFSDKQMELANLAFQILNWENNTQFCGHCGHSMKRKETERAKFCEKCEFISYPNVAPAVIVLVTDGDKMLLAKNAQRPSGFYSTLAGFVDPSESLEQTIHREIFEEVGVRVKNIRYFGSQSWPFPNTLMCAFLADYDSGEIKVDQSEISDAKWFSIEDLPDMPPSFSISRQMIDSHIKKVRQ